MRNQHSHRIAHMISRGAITLIIATVVGSGCDRPNRELPGNQATKAAEPEVRVVSPERKAIEHRIEQPGFNIEAFEETALYARITGYVGKWHVDIGDSVKTDQVLAELYVPDLVVAKQQKEAALKQATAQVAQAKAAKLASEAQLTHAKQQSDRLTKVGKEGALSPESVAEAVLNHEAAKAGLEKAKADVTAAEAHVEVAAANRDYAKTMLDYAQIRAPYDGVVTQRNVKTGDFVQPAGAGSHGTPLFVVSLLDPVRVFVNIPGSSAGLIKDGDMVELLLQGAGGTPVQGKVIRNAHALTPQSRTLRTEIDLPNPADKTGHRRLLPGMYVQTTITVRHAKVWTLPAAAVRTVGAQTFCYRIIENKAVKTPLEVGLRTDKLVEIVKMQTRPGTADAEPEWSAPTGSEEIAASDLDALSDGQAIRRKQDAN